MALTNKKYNRLHDKTGSDKNDMKIVHDGGHLGDVGDNPSDYPMLTTLVYQIQEMQEELDYLRTEISAITANTAKTGITTQQASTIIANDKAVNNNASEITKNKNAISNQAVEVNAAIKVGAYPPVLYAPPGFIQTHTSEVVYDTKLKKYFLNISYIEITPGKGGGKSQRIIRTGQIELK